MNESWIKETMALLDDWEKEKSNLEDKLEEMEGQIFELDDKITGGQALVQAYIDKHNITPLLEDVPLGHYANMSYPEMLVEIAQSRQGYLKVADAVDILLKANIGSDRRSIQANIYSALRRKKKQFSKKSMLF